MFDSGLTAANVPFLIMYHSTGIHLLLGGWYEDIISSLSEYSIVKASMVYIEEEQEKTSDFILYKAIKADRI